MIFKFMAKKTKKVNIFLDSVLNSLWLFGFCMVIVLFCIVFLVGEMDSFLRFMMGLLTALPLCVLFYTRGCIVAMREFSVRNPAITPDKATSVNKVPLSHALIMIAPYVVLLVVCVLIGNLGAKLYPFQSISLYVCLPSSICFKALGLIPTMSESNWFAVLAVMIFLLIMVSMYLLGFYKTLKDKERSFQDMLNEIRFNSKL
jgi:hypothetical protein